MTRKNSISDETLITALLNCGSVKEASEKFGINIKTFYERMKKENFKLLYQQARSETLKVATARLQKYVNTAISVTAKIAVDEGNSAQVRLNAAQILLTYAVRFTELMDFSERLTAIEEGAKNDES